MDFLIILALSLSLWAALIISLLGWRMYGARATDSKELLSQMSATGPFFSDFEILKKLFLRACSRFSGFLCFLLNKITPRAKSWTVGPRLFLCRILDFLYGKISIEKNGCSGYWHELNEATNGNGSTGHTTNGDSDSATKKDS